MKRVNLNNIKVEQPHFIGSWNIENNTLCEEIISFFEENQNLQKSGFTGSGVKPTLKKTTDITVKPNDLKNIKFKCLNTYINELLHKCFLKIIKISGHF